MRSGTRHGLSSASRGLYAGCSLLSTLIVLFGLATLSRRLVAQTIPTQETSAIPDQPIVLEPGKTIDAAIAPGGKRTYQILLTPGQYAEIEVIPKRVLALSVLLKPLDDQRELFLNTGFGGVAVPLLAAKDGSFLLTLQRMNRMGGDGEFQITLSPPRDARPDDETRLAAAQAFGEGEKKYADRSAQASREKLERYQKALDLWRQLGDKRQQVLCLMRLGQVHGYLYENSQAVEYLEQALAASQSLNFYQAEDAISMSLAMSYGNLGEKQKAIESLRRALEISRKIGHKYAEAIALMSLGQADTSVDALDYLQQALLLFREIGEHSGEAHILDQLGESYLSRGRQQEGMEGLHESLQAASAAGGDDHYLPYIMRHLAHGYAMQGDLLKALDYYFQALPLQRAKGDAGGQGETMVEIGSMYLSLGAPSKALEYSSQASTVLQTVQNPGLQASAILQLGRAYSEMGETETALTHFQRALVLYRNLAEPVDQADVLTAIGDSYLKQGKLQAGLDRYRQALAIYRTAPHEEAVHLGAFHGEEDILRSIGAVQVSLGHIEDARKSLNQALEILPTAGHTTEDEAAILFELARAERAAGRLPQALERITTSIDLTEKLRRTVAGPDLRASYVAKVRDRYELLIALLMQLHRLRPGQGYDVRALEASERARARSLLDLLNEARDDMLQDAEPALLERERSLQEQMRFKAAYRLQFLSKKHTPQQASALEEEIGNLSSAYEETEAQLRARSPRYAGLTQPQPLTLSGIQDLLGPDTALIEYSLGVDESFLWVVTNQGMNSYPLPKRAEVEALARRAYQEMSANNSSGGQQATVALGRLLLARIPELRSSMRLVVVAEGALDYISFAALRTSPRGAPMVAGHEIVYLPSASTLPLLRREMKARIQPPKQIAVLADPVFSAGDPRVTGAVGADGAREDGSAQRSEKPDLEHSAQEAGLFVLDRLPASRREAKTIVDLAGPDHSLQALDFDANLKTATSSELEQYRIIHFASHTLLNSAHPELSGIVLSLVDKQGHPQDGFLQANQIFNLKLNADMVVLSACRTALGKEVRGEGLVGLTRAFMYAGAPRVVASLWRVPDSATAELMRLFYQGLLIQGLSPAASLRQSQLALAQDKRWSAPYYWAGFALQGEWK